MSTTEPSPNYRFSPLGFLLWLPAYIVIALILYFAVLFLLSGPFYWSVYEAYYMDGDPLTASYFYPLALACEYEPVAKAVDWYVGLWVL
ncbi:hypothetical protein [Calycomorphotria hydatis]|uniref:Uncharacterized protein n=1 Tax=Calycomorphotria hydatis TaxID=2528027 RepID=A0A517TAA0_9PLAN|nr:hypothetical protein [Calycomorphotria hydatis]QDT65301.1 hypothetical protein V22_25490 [Calycomorphotria hydatis]